MGARISPERRARIAELRAEGRIWREIAAEVGMSPEGARRSFGRSYAAKIGRPKTAALCERAGGCDRPAYGGRKFCAGCAKTSRESGVPAHLLGPKRKFRKGVDKTDGGA